MSIKSYPFFIRGLQISRDDLEDYGIEDLNDDRWLPYIEAHYIAGYSGVLITIKMSNTGDGDIFIGWVKNMPYDPETQSVKINAPDKTKIVEKLRRMGIQFENEEVIDMLAKVCM